MTSSFQLIKRDARALATELNRLPVTHHNDTANLYRLFCCAKATRLTLNETRIAMADAGNLPPTKQRVAEAFIDINLKTIEIWLDMLLSFKSTKPRRIERLSRVKTAAVELLSVSSETS